MVSTTFKVQAVNKVLFPIWSLRSFFDSGKSMKTTDLNKNPQAEFSLSRVKGL